MGWRVIANGVVVGEVVVWVIASSVVWLMELCG